MCAGILRDILFGTTLFRILFLLYSCFQCCWASIGIDCADGKKGARESPPNFDNNRDRSHENDAPPSPIEFVLTGRDLWVMVVSASPYEHMIGKPDVKYVANMHGNEAVGRELMLHLIQVHCHSHSSFSSFYMPSFGLRLIYSLINYKILIIIHC